MKWNVAITSLVVCVGLCTPGFSFELLDRMLGGGYASDCCDGKGGGKSDGGKCCTQKHLGASQKGGCCDKGHDAAQKGGCGRCGLFGGCGCGKASLQKGSASCQKGHGAAQKCGGNCGAQKGSAHCGAQKGHGSCQKGHDAAQKGSCCCRRSLADILFSHKCGCDKGGKGDSGCDVKYDGLYKAYGGDAPVMPPAPVVEPSA